tara:strand:- start:719 stop:1024 length:306 start_codon:yes stop_codon:yes gene_type:complete
VNKEKLYLIDWGKDCDGARYAIIQSSRENLFSAIDEIGDPSIAKFVEVASCKSESFYVELPGVEIKDDEDKEYSDISKGPGMNTMHLDTPLKLEWEDFLAA